MRAVIARWKLRGNEIYKEYKLSFEPRPDYPLDQSKPNVFNPDLWSKIPSGHLRYAFRLAVLQQLQSIKEYLYLLRIRKRPVVDDLETTSIKDKKDQDVVPQENSVATQTSQIVTAISSDTKSTMQSSLRTFLHKLLSPEELAVIRSELSQGINSPRDLFTNARLKVVSYQVVQRYMMIVQEYINEFMVGYRKGVKDEEEAFLSSRNAVEGTPIIKKDDNKT